MDFTSIKDAEVPEEAIKQTLETETSFTDKFQATIKQSPFLVAGIVGLTTVCGVGAYKWRTRTVIASVFLTQLRVAAQGTALACITLGMAYNMYNDFIVKKKKE